MKTQELVELLARRAGAVAPRAVQSRLAGAALAGLVAATIVVFAGLGVNPQLGAMGASLVLKLAYIGALALAAGWLTDRASRPGVRSAAATAAVVGVVLAMAALACVALIDAPAGQAGSLLLGSSWRSCPWRIALLSVPALALLLWAIRTLAPPSGRIAGFAAGLLAGALGALAYALYCTETSPAFVLVWYSSGVLLSALAGAAIGSRVLKW